MTATITNSQAIKLLRAEFPEIASSKIRRTYDRVKKRGEGVQAAYEFTRNLLDTGAFDGGEKPAPDASEILWKRQVWNRAYVGGNLDVR